MKSEVFKHVSFGVPKIEKNTVGHPPSKKKLFPSSQLHLEETCRHVLFSRQMSMKTQWKARKIARESNQEPHHQMGKANRGSSVCTAMRWPGKTIQLQALFPMKRDNSEYVPRVR